ncbi:hypothetical protein ILUMI_00682 [Ignelater luminosus]|uniref:Uncharacterized protein n=1 Tax=Ignelater luminosus TaxID=2038154 RepID=A0A8K0DLT2_IGNLU|nr:hypothetical protein ILUMI_00682 [Ignelater luminosus]
MDKTGVTTVSKPFTLPPLIFARQKMTPTLKKGEPLDSNEVGVVSSGNDEQALGTEIKVQPGPSESPVMTSTNE